MTYPPHSSEPRIAAISQRHPSFPSKAALLSRLIREAYHGLRDEIGAVLAEWNVNYAEYSVLMMMYGSEQHTVLPSQLAEASGEKAANVTRLTNGLVARGWIERAAATEDRRQVLLTLTAKGRAAVKTFLPAVSATLQRQTADFSAKEAEQFEQLLRKFLARTDPR
jgi:MarR family transcriptional repressor of emrRAB